MKFTKLSRTEGKGSVLLNGHHAVAVYQAQGQTIIRTTAGGENASFVVSEDATDVIGHLTKAGCTFVELTRVKDAKPLYLNASQIVGVYARQQGFTTVRTTAAGDHAEYVVPETPTVVEGKLSEAYQTARVSTPVSMITGILKTPKARSAARTAAM
jgi:Holliday junction resolvase